MTFFEKCRDYWNAHFVIPQTLEKFEKTRYGKKLASYKDKYIGQRCFFIGNGPSLCADDLTRLHEAGEITFAFNRIYNIFENTSWRPTFYVSQDEKILAGSVKEVDEICADAKFIPIQLKWWHGISVGDANYFNIVHQLISNPENSDFSDDVSKEIFNSATVMYTAAQIASYMGFREIYLIGVDHHFRISQNNDGKIIVDDSVKDYFSEKYNEDREKLYIPNTENSTLTYMAMKYHCGKRKINVFNATRGGKLEVFQRVEFDSLF